MKKPLVALGLFIVIAALVGAQVRPASDTGIEGARKALNLGQYDRVATLLGTSTDPRAIALRARIDIDHGRYAEAEKLLAGPAASAPGPALLRRRSAARPGWCPASTCPISR